MVLVDRLPGHSTAVIVHGLVLYLVHLEGSKLSNVEYVLCMTSIRGHYFWLYRNVIYACENNGNCTLDRS